MITPYKEFKQWLETLDHRPRLLLHSCCAPCSSYVLLFLKNYFDITIFYTNDNIAPQEEYEKRLKEQIRLARELNIPLIQDSYRPQDYEQAVQGYEDQQEGGKRCYLCYRLRLLKTALKAKALQMDYFTTTLSVSPYKNSRWINEIGYALEQELKIGFVYSDFKKEEGYKQSVALSKEYQLYRQHYCGCIFSKKED